ncbi:uncharacterized protein LOC125041719 [Penaeus chinensis]|uniref:uncharacterized protein LOC125041719 n=1 Tax=Penaeus chinensis TaxID=139456 RepID=UPI001FB604F4|nr:uncharacterized protein LOC125041719 [Penaeus chinensis]
MKDANGVVLTDENDIKERWRIYFEQLMNVENYRIDRVIEARPEQVIDVITAEEVERALRKMKKGKATGLDDIPVEAWKVLGRTGVIILLEIFTIMETEKIPDEWRESTLIPIFKNKGDIQDCGNYRGIKLMAHTLKMWESYREEIEREGGYIRAAVRLYARPVHNRCDICPETADGEIKRRPEGVAQRIHRLRESI